MLRRVGVVLLLAACTTPYQPAVARVPAMPPDAFDRVVAVTRMLYPGLAQVDREGFRIQSAWLPLDDGECAGQKRASVFRVGEDELGVVVETRYLGIDLLGTPTWSTARGDRGLERELLGAVVGAVEG